ncbi:MAG: hypothetical protein ACO36I_23960, partial [Candidatus Latescibacterota bacterium]
MAISVKKVDLHVLNMHTRFPFKYGIASLVALPHLFVRVTVNIDGKSEIGLAADGLPPKWFTKNPTAPFTEDLEEMLAVIWHACRHVEGMGEATTVFDLWDRLYKAQAEWAKSTAYPPLLWAFGVSLVERAVIDAFCRAKGVTFAEALQNNALGIWLGDIHSELKNKNPSDFLPSEPLSAILVRHTVGLADPLTDAEIDEADRIDDGLPHSLAANIEAYGLTHLKIKLCGDAERDLSRLKQIAWLMAGQETCQFTLDGNEQYTEVAPFRSLWNAIYGDVRLKSFMKGLIFVEQPFRRDVALSAQVKDVLLEWTDR